MNGLTKIDASVLSQLNRALIGFDRMFDAYESRLHNSTGYPPYNIVRIEENKYLIEMAVAGFRKDEITVEIEQNQLTIKGQSDTLNENQTRDYIYRGLSSRDFVRTFPLAEHIVVKEARMENGVLTVELERVIPEALKARVVDIVEVK